MTTNDLLKNIIILEKKLKLSKIERKRFEKDLEAIYSRLIKREYKKTGFWMNKFDVPNRTKEIFTELEFYALLGKTWSEILENLNLSKKTKIADICPGFVPKIELGLFYKGFKGNIDLLDSDPDSYKELIKFIQLFKPGFKMRGIKINLFKNNNLKYDIILGNHIIDDLVMFYFSKKINLDLQNVYKNETDYKKLWAYILNNKTINQKEIITIIFQSINYLMKNNSIVIITQYKSYMEKITDSNETYKFNLGVFKEIENIFLKNNFSKLPKNKLSKNLHFTEKNYFIFKKNEN